MKTYTPTFRNAHRLGLAGLLAALALTIGFTQPSAGQTRPDAAQAQSESAQDFVFLGESRPVLIRMHVQVDGKPLQVVWNDFMKSLFNYLDVNGDGMLSPEEAERVPSLNRILSGGVNQNALFDGFPGGREPAGPTLAQLDSDNDGKVSLAELSAYYRKSGLTPFQFQPDAASNNRSGVVFFGGGAREPSAREIGESIFALLDTNKNGKLSREELVAAPSVLLKLDENIDEIVTARELVINDKPPANDDPFGGMRGPGMMPGSSRGAKGNKNLIPILKSGVAPDDLVSRLQERYGSPAKKGQQKMLSRKDLGLDEATFARLDVNGDGVLDALELAAFANRRPDLEVVMKMGSTTGVALAKTEVPAPLAGKVEITDGQALAKLGLTRLSIHVGEDGPQGLMDGDDFPGFGRDAYIAQFKQADKDNNGQLDAAEAKASRFFRDVFKAIDREGSGKITEKDFVAYLDQMSKFKRLAQKAAVTLSTSDQSTGLFDLLDTNHDGRLSVREMRGAAKLLEQLGLQDKGYVTLADLPSTHDLRLRSGPVSPGNNSGTIVVNSMMGGPPSGPPVPTAGPLWFRKMDRNGDGDVSRREFLGTDEQFRQIDTDGDGLISREEAERYDALRRKPK